MIYFHVMKKMSENKYCLKIKVMCCPSYSNLSWTTLSETGCCFIFPRTLENALKTTSIQKVLSLAVEMTKDIVAEILSSNDEYFQEIAAQCT